MITLENLLEQTKLVDSFGSRYGEKRDVYECNVEPGTYYIIGKSRYYRAGSSEDGQRLEYVDFEGGPFISVGDPFLGHKLQNMPNVTDLEIVKLQSEGYFCAKFKTKK